MKNLNNLINVIFTNLSIPMEKSILLIITAFLSLVIIVALYFIFTKGSKIAFIIMCGSALILLGLYLGRMYLNHQIKSEEAKSKTEQPLSNMDIKMAAPARIDRNFTIGLQALKIYLRENNIELTIDSVQYKAINDSLLKLDAKRAFAKLDAIIKKMNREKAFALNK
jgi:hypothetical protein